MTLKNLDQLTYEIDQAVHPNGPLGKTTAPGLNQVLKSLATEVITLPQVEGGGTAPRALTYAEVLRRQQAGELEPGAYYLIGERPTPTLGSSGDVLIQAAAPDALALEGVLCARVPDYARVPLWRTNFFEQGAVSGVTYAQADSTFVPLLPQDTDLVDYRLDGDDNVVVAQLPFAFAYGGQSFTQVAVDSNGRLVLDPAYFKSDYHQHALAPGYASVYLCWGDLFVSPGTVRYFLTGQAPYRKFVADFSNTIPQTSISNGYFHYSGIFSGQIVLEETTNAVTIGLSANTLTETTWIQGLQYPGQAYQVDAGSVLRSGVAHRFTPVIARAAVTPALAAGPLVRWRGQTWQLAAGGDVDQEPGTGPAWTLAAGDERDAFGNSVPSYDAVRYDLAGDGISQRRDSQGNVVEDSSLAGFPWGNPGARDNYLRAVTLDDSLHCVDGLQFNGNRLVEVSLTNVALAGIDFRDNYLTDARLQDYAPRRFAGVTATHGLDPAYVDCTNQRFWQGQLVREAGAVATELLQNTLYRQSQVRCAIYKSGQPVSYRTPDFTHPVSSVIPDHDRIDLLGDWSGRTLWLRNFDFTINGNNVVVGGIALGNGSTGQRMSLTSLGVTGSVTFSVPQPLTNSPNLNPQASATTGMRVTLRRCTLGQLSLAGGSAAAGTDLSYFTVSYCAIDRLSNLNAGAGTRHRFSHCVFGQGQTSGSVFGGAGPEQASALVITNSIVYLNGTTTLYDNNTPPATAPIFQNVTLVAADGTVSRLDNQAITVSQANSATTAGLEVVAVATLFGTISASGFNTLPISSPGLDVRPSGTAGGWDQPNNAYVAPLSGTYEILTKARIDDGSGPVGGNYALGAGPSNVDGAWVAWNTIVQTTGTNRKGHQTTRILHLNAGDAVHMYLYCDGFDASIGGELSIKLLHRD